MMNTTSNAFAAAVLALATALTTAGCATEETSTDMPDLIWVDATEIVSASGARSTELVGLGMSPEPVVIDSGACACESTECVEIFVRDNIGCDLCVDFTCADRDWVGGCVRCDP
jgi:hypothetical protein